MWPGAVEHLYRAEIEFKVDEAVVDSEHVSDDEVARVTVATQALDLGARERSCIGA